MSELKTITFECNSCCNKGKCRLDVEYDSSECKRSDIASPESCSYGWFNKVEWTEVEHKHAPDIEKADPLSARQAKTLERTVKLSPWGEFKLSEDFDLSCLYDRIDTADHFVKKPSLSSHSTISLC